MKVRHFILAFVWLISTAAVPAMAQATQETARAVHVPAGDMADAVESLARQCDVNVMYPSALLKGQKTQGVSGTFAPTAAFGKLLEGTPFGLSGDDSALLITQIAPAPDAPTATRAETPLEQVRIEGWRETDGAVGRSGQGAEASGPRFVKWDRHEFWVACAPTRGVCNFRREMKVIFERLGARDLVVHDLHASFFSLMPAANDAQDAAASHQTARWVKVTFRGTGYHGRDDDGDGLVLYSHLKTDILPLFTTRNLQEENSRRMSVEVLQAAP
jgi:hypothetical protein